MNGYVLAWMAISSSASGALGVLFGRKLGWNDAYQSGRASQQAWDDYEAQQQQIAAGRPTASSMLDEAARAGRLRETMAFNHGHHVNQACTAKCYQGRQ